MKKFSKRLLTFVLACAMVFGLSGMTAFAAEEEDPGISTLDSGDEYEPSYDWYVGQTSPYEISSAADLVGLSNIVNGTAPENVGTDTFNGKTITVNVAANNGEIDMNEATVDWDASDNDGVVNIDKTVDGALVFTPIGNLENPFEGTFDGNGVLIKDLYVTSDDGCLGLFGAVGSKDAAQEGACGTVENFSLTGIVECTGGNSTTQKDFVGGAVGRLYAGGTIEYVTNEHLLVDAPGTDNVGGIVGFAGTPTGEGYSNNPSVSNTSVSCCENKATIRAYYKVAGIVGENAATVKYCCNSGWIMCRRNTSKGAGVAGIVGRNGNNGVAAEEALVAYCYNTGPITNNGHNDDSATNTIRGYAGICGTTYGATGKVETHNCYNVGAIPKGYGEYNSITSEIEGGAAVAVRDNYTPSDLVNVSIFNAGDSTQECGDMTYTVEQFKVSSRDDNEFLAKLGVYFEPDYEADEDALNDHYPILFWQAGDPEPKITDLRIETPPKKTAYNGEVFDPTGMVVIATYSNGAEMEIPCSYVTYNDSTYTLSDGYTYDTEKEIASDETQFPITFDGMTKNVNVNGIPVVTSTGDEYQLTYSAIDTFLDEHFDASRITPSDGSRMQGHFAKFSSLLDKCLDIPASQYCSIVVSDAEGNSVTVPGEIYTELDNCYLYKDEDEECYRMAGNQISTAYFYKVAEIEVTFHNYEYEWTWSEDYSSATVTRKCTICESEAEVTTTDIVEETTAPGERTVGKTTYTATATFEDKTTATDSVDADFVPATGSIAIEINKGGDEPDTSELAYSTINGAMDNTKPQTFTYTSGGGTNEVTKPFVTISSLLKIEDTINNVCCYHVIADMPDNYYEIDLPTTTCLYYRDDSLIYRTAVNGSAGRMWVDNPTTIEVNYVHDWGDLTWKWSDDYSEATVTGSCQRSVCKKYGVEETATATVTSTTTATATKDGETTYTATATFSDGTEVTDTETVDQQAFDPDGYITVVVNGASMEIANTTIDAAIEAADTITIANSSGTEVTAKFVKLSDLIGISEEDFTGFTVTDSDDAVTANLPTGTYLYWRDDRACYRIAVNGGARNLWRDDPTTIEVVGFATVDKTNLDATIEEAKELNEADYTAESWDALQTVLADAEEVSASIVATQDAVNKAEDSLKEAIDNLVPTAPADKDALEAAIEEAKDLVESDYSDGWDAFEAALDAAETVDSSTDVSQSAVDAATKALTDAMDALVAKTADKTALEDEIAAVETATQDLVPSDYTDESWAALEDALEAAKTTDEESDPLQSAVDKATEALADAMNALTAKTADKTALEDEIAAANDLVESDYTPESWVTLIEALEAAMSVDESQDPLQSEVDTAAKALQDAIDALEVNPADKSVLEAAVKAAEALDAYKDYYTEDSWNALQDALTAAKTVADNGDATQSSVNSATVDLVNALANLVPAQQPAAEVDKSVLDAAITAAEALNDYQSYYTDDSWNDLQSALDEAKDVSADPDATQDAVNEATVALVAALADLQPANESGTGGDTKNGLYRIVGGQLWGYFVNGEVDTSYTGFQKNENGTWYVENGYINFAKNSVYKDNNGELGTKGTWYYVVGNKVQYGFTGLAHYRNENGWWYIVNGVVDFSHNGVDKNQNGWWYVTGGKVQFDFTGLANYKNQYGWWYISNGKVNFYHNGVDKNQNGWWYVTGGKVQFDFTGLAHYKNQYGWWYVNAGKVDFTYNGIATNQNGTWYIIASKVRFDYNGTVTADGTTYTVQNGRVR